MSLAVPVRAHGCIDPVRSHSGLGRIGVALAAAVLSVALGVWPASAQVSSLTLSSVEADGLALTLAFDGALSRASVPPASSFVVTVDGSARAVRGVDVRSRAVTLTLVTAVQAGQNVQLSYAVPSSNPLRGAGFIPVAAITDYEVANDTSPRAPVLSGASVNGLILNLTYDEYLDTDSTPPASSFSVTVDGIAHTVVTPMMVSTYMRLIVTPAVQAGQSVKVSYAVPTSHPVQDIGGTPAGAYTGRAVHNTTSASVPPNAGASVNGAVISLNYRDELDSGSVPSASSFTFEVDGVKRAVTSVTVEDTKVLLTIVSAAQAGQSTRISYAVPTSNPIQSVDGVFAVAYTDHSVSNYTISQAPQIQTAKLDATGLTITLTYDEDLDTGSTPPTTSFGVKVGDETRSVVAAAVRGRTVVLILDSPVVYDGQNRVYVSYTASSSSPIRDIGGTLAYALNSRGVDRDAIRSITPRPDPSTTEPPRPQVDSGGGGGVSGAGGGGGGGGGGSLEPSTAVIIAANGWSPPDIGVAAALSARTPESAVIYTTGDRLSVAARDLLVDYLPGRVIVVGGEAAVSDAALTSMRSASESESVERITGATRSETAAAAARRILDDAEPDGATVIIANGWSPADIGVAAALSSRTPRSAVAYTASGTLPDATQRLLSDYQPGRVLIVGGETAVESAVASEVRSAVPGARVERVGDATRTGTAAGVARRFLGPHQSAVTDGLAIIVANGWSPPDTGVAAALSARTEGSAVLYTETGRLSAEAAEVLRDYQPTRVVFVGGPAAITSEVKDQARAIVPDATVLRYSGSTRTQTAAAVARRSLGAP